MKLVQLVFFLFITILFSCEDVVLVDCDKCTAEEPAEAKLVIKISDGVYNASMSNVSIYEGDIEDNILFNTVNSYPGEITAMVPVNKKYTVTITYHLVNGSYTAVDSALPRVKYDKDQCDEPCYYVYDNTINLKLKYQ